MVLFRAAHGGQRIARGAARRGRALGDEGAQGLGLQREAVRAQEIETFAAGRSRCAAGPIRRMSRASGSSGGGWVSTAERATMRSRLVRLRHVEMVDGVAEDVGVGEQLGARIELELEADQPLAGRTSAAASTAPSRFRAPGRRSGIR